MKDLSIEGDALCTEKEISSTLAFLSSTATTKTIFTHKHLTVHCIIVINLKQSNS